MTLTLTPEVEALLQKEMSTGRFQNPSDLIETALLVLADSIPRDLTTLDAIIQEGIDEEERGEFYTEEEARAYIASVRANL